ncbi:MAG: diguanylate cyclase, partial [Enterobacterales bacterium]|nr:diguanylate cyclase [Enterobacterales bacterium]
MRITTKLFAFITVLVALAMLLMLLGSTYSFFNQSHHRAENQLNALATTIDQLLLTEPRSNIKKWLPVVMRSSGVNEIIVHNNSHQVYQLKLPTSYNAWDTLTNQRYVDAPLMHHPGYSLKMVYIDPTASYTRSLETMFPVTVSIGLMILVLLFSYRWLREQTLGREKLERRARKILGGERENAVRGDVHEFPPNASSAIDRLLSDLADAREERGRVDTLIRAFAAQDSRTGLNNRLFFDNQLTTQLEDEGAHGVVMVIRVPDWESMAGLPGKREREEYRYSLVNMLSTSVMRYPSGLLARYFQNNFAVLLPHRSLKEAEGFASQLINSVSAIPPANGIDSEEVLHIGISLYHYGQSTEQVMDQAEQAARNAVLQGSNGWFIDSNPVPEVVRGSVKWRTLLEQTLARGGPTLLQKEAVSVSGEVHH